MAEKQEACEPMTGGSEDPENPPEYTRPSDAPPSYDSLFGKIKKAKDESSGNVDFARKTIGMILCGTVFCSLCTIFMLAIPISMIVMGALHLDKCPRERFIPIYLLVGGCFGVVKALFNAGMTFRRHRNDEDDSEKAKPNPLESLVDCFMFAWLIAGCVWVYRTYNDYQWTDPSLPTYCDHTLYLYAFWLLTSSFIVCGLLLVCGCLCCCIGCCMLKDT